MDIEIVYFIHSNLEELKLLKRVMEISTDKLEEKDQEALYQFNGKIEGLISSVESNIN